MIQYLRKLYLVLEECQMIKMCHTLSSCRRAGLSRAGSFFQSLFISIFLYSVSFLFAQSDSQIQYFRGGHIDVVSQVSMAGPTPIFMHPAANSTEFQLNVAYNPAFLNMCPGRNIVIHAGLPVRLNLSGLAGLDARVKTGMDNAFEPYQDHDAPVIYPLIDASLKTTVPIQKIELTLLKYRHHVAASWENMIGLSNRTRIVGMEMRASTPTESGSSVSDVVLNARINSHFDFDFRIQRANAMVAFPLGDHVHLGVQISRLFVHFATEGQAFVDATMLYSGSEYAFNDPNALWPTSLDQYIKGQYKGQSMQYRIGFCRRTDKSIWEFMMDAGAFIQCRGDLEMHQNTIPAFQLDALLEGNEDSEILDASELNLSQLTLTAPVQNTTYQKIRIGLPAIFQAGYMRLIEPFRWYLGVSGYYGDYTLKYGPSSMQLKPKWKSSICLQYKSWSLYADIMLVKSVIQEVPALSSRNIQTLIPRLAVGRFVEINRWRVHPSLQFSPNPSIQTSIQMEI